MRPTSTPPPVIESGSRAIVWPTSAAGRAPARSSSARAIAVVARPLPSSTFRATVVPFGATRLSLVLPLGDARFLCRNNASNLRLDDQRGNASLLGHAELEISTGQGAKTSCKIELGATPEIPEPDAKEKDGENGGADADAGKK